MIYRAKRILPSLLVLIACRWCTASDANDATPPEQSSTIVWSLDDFDDFRAGTFGDGGANAYVSARGRVQPIHRNDINNDGLLDLVFVNTHPQGEKLDAVIYWGNGKDFDDRRTTPVPNNGAQWMTAADVNRDGQMDVVVPNYANGTWSKMDSCVYYGGIAELERRPKDSPEWGLYPFAHKSSLPSEAAQQAAVGDLNRDGYEDLVFALSAGFWEYRGPNALASPSRIYWGGEDGFQRDNFTDIDASGASDVAVADLNNDQWPDVVFANRERDGNFDVSSYIYWGGKEGYTAKRRTELPTHQANGVTLADADGDGELDVLFANGAGDKSYIYLNQDGQFDEGRRVELPSMDARDIAAADLNDDGHPDVFITNFQNAENPRTKSYVYWGGADGFSPQRRQELETVGACGTSIADLNGDDLPEIVVSNSRDYQSFEVPSYVFWNSRNGFDPSRRTGLFTHGAIGNTVADFNGDGHPDLLFCNTMSRSRGGVGPSYVYWGKPDGLFSADDRLELPSLEPYGWTAADLNDDGWVELVIGNMAEVGRSLTENFIFWGSSEGLSPDRRTALVGNRSRTVNVADLDRDGYLDLVFLNTLTGIYIYWGSADGYVTTDRIELAGGGSGFPVIADLNHDGNLDLLLAGNPTSSARIYWGNGDRNYSLERSEEVPDSFNSASVEVADMNRDGLLDVLVIRRGEPGPPSFVYYGQPNGEFSIDHRCEFRPLSTQGVTVADVNGDNWLDVIAPRYTDTGSRATMSRIYFNSPEGLSESNIMELPTNGGTGSQLYDYNHDGYDDLLLVCHRGEGNENKVGAISDHCTDSYLYWGGPAGFDPDRKHLIPGRGVHYDSGIDLGDIADRRFGFEYVSPPRKMQNKRPNRIDWVATTPHGSSVEFQIRSAPSMADLPSAPWSGPGGPGTHYHSAGQILGIDSAHEWIQFRAQFHCPTGVESPSLDSVTFSAAARSGAR